MHELQNVRLYRAIKWKQKETLHKKVWLFYFRDCFVLFYSKDPTVTLLNDPPQRQYVVCTKITCQCHRMLIVFPCNRIFMNVFFSIYESFYVIYESFYGIYERFYGIYVVYESFSISLPATLTQSDIHEKGIFSSGPNCVLWLLNIATLSFWLLDC